MKIVGVGAGPNLLTLDAINAIKNAKIIYGSKRAIEIAKEYINCKSTIVSEIKDYNLAKLKEIPKNAVVLSTGDPMLSGLGFLDGEVISGISSLQIACARLKISLTNLAIITMHGRNIEKGKIAIVNELKQGKNVFLLPDPKFGVQPLAEFLQKHNLKVQIAVCENLAYPDERIEIGTTANPPSNESDLYCIVLKGVRC